MLRVEVSLANVKVALEKFRADPVGALEGLVQGWRAQFSSALTQLMDAEIELFLGQERQAGKDNARNGYVDRTFAVKGVGLLEIRAPRDRSGKFISAVLPPRQRYDTRIQQDMALMHLGGMSTRTIELMSERFFGRRFSAQEVSEATATLHASVEAWRSRPLEARYKYIFLDGTFFAVRRKDVGREPVLVAIGVEEDGTRAVLGFQSGDKESATTWNEFLGDLLRRGLNPDAVQLGLMDGLAGLQRTFTQRFRRAKVQRCQIHKSRNVLAKIPRRLQEEFRPAMTSVFYNEGLEQSQKAFASLKAKYGRLCPDAVKCLEDDLESVLTFYAFPRNEWPSLRSTNPIERLNKEFKRRTNSMEIVGGEKSMYTLLAYVSMRMEHGWRSSKVGQKNVVHLNSFEVALTHKT